MKVILTDAYSFTDYDYALEKEIFAKAGIEFQIENCRGEDEVLERCTDADVLLAIYQPVGERVMAAMKHCRGMVRYGIGFDIYDMDAATRYGIPICNIPDYCIPEVAAHTMALLLALTRQLHMYTNNVKKGLWDHGLSSIPMRRPGSQILGVAGFGNIGRAVAERAKPFGYNIIAYDPYLPAEVFEKAGVEQVPLEEIFTRSDIITCHTPYNASTYHLLDRAAFAQMKDGVIIVNTSRGPIICEEDLIEALRSGKVGAAGLDVIEHEPITRPDHPFAAMDNVLLTPHAAYISEEASRALHCRTAETAVSLLRGERITNIVNKRALGLV